MLGMVEASNKQAVYLVLVILAIMVLFTSIILNSKLIVVIVAQPQINVTCYGNEIIEIHYNETIVVIICTLSCDVKVYTSEKTVIVTCDSNEAFKRGRSS